MDWVLLHLGTGKMIEKHRVPAYKGVIPGPGPFERAACGVYVPPERTTLETQKVNCGSCQRTRACRAGGSPGDVVA